MGGKFYLKNKILPYFPKDIYDYIEPFLGGGSVFLNLQSAKIHVQGTSYLNDLDNDISLMWKTFNDRTLFIEFSKQFQLFNLYSEDIFEFIKNGIGEETDPAIFTFKKIMLILMSFQGNCESYYVGHGDYRRRNAKIYKLRDYWVKYHDYLVKYNSKISKKDWKEFFKNKYNRDTSFYYLDPPYINTRGYEIPFELEDHVKLAQELGESNGRWALSINNCEESREIYCTIKGIRVIELTTRHASNSKSKLNKKNGVNELLILNY